MTTRTPQGLPTIPMWLAALRGNAYEQAEGHLRNADNRFCCLGVYCDLIDSRAWVPEFFEDTVDEDGHYRNISKQLPFTYGTYGDQLIEGDLGELVAGAVGLTEQAQQVLAEMNDSRRDFHTIAAAVERCTVDGKLDDTKLTEVWTEMQRESGVLSGNRAAGVIIHDEI